MISSLVKSVYNTLIHWFSFTWMKPLRGRFFIQIVIIQLSFTFFLTIAMTDTEPTDTPPFDAARLAKAVRQRLQSLQRSGVSSIQTQTGQSVDLHQLQNQLRHIQQHGLPIDESGDSQPSAGQSGPSPIDTIAKPPTTTPAPPNPTSTLTPSPVPEQIPSTSPTAQESEIMPSKKQAELDIVCQEVADCKACVELASTRNKTVFGVGNANARLVFYGEAPGADEDKQGEPFVGRAGKLLNKIIEAMGLTRDEIYILNTIKCRPPGNRNPTPEEQQNCAGFLKRQLEIIQPEYIVCLGAVASHSFLECNTPIGKMRQQFFEKNGIKVLCTFHPAYLLRDPRRKRDVWDDIQFLMKDMGLPIPEKTEGVR